MRTLREYSPIVARREADVARFICRGLTLQEIQDRMTENGNINPDTGAPWSIPTISFDAKRMRKRWQKEAAADTAILRSRQLMEIQEVKRTAYMQGNMDAVLRALRHEADLLGLIGVRASLDGLGTSAPEFMAALSQAGAVAWANVTAPEMVDESSNDDDDEQDEVAELREAVTDILEPGARPAAKGKGGKGR